MSPLERLHLVSERLEALRRGAPPPARLADRLRQVLGVALELPGRPRLHALSQALDLAGVHTAADAQLLKDLASERGTLGHLARGLTRRAEEALAEFEGAVAVAERLAGLEALPQAARRALRGELQLLARVVKLAHAFAAPRAQEVPFELFTPARRSLELTGPPSPRLAVAEFYASRARQAVEDLAGRRDDLERAHQLLLLMGGQASREEREPLRRLKMEVSAAREKARAEPRLKTLQDLARELKQQARADVPRAYRQVKALYDRAVEAGDAPLAEVTSRALLALLPDASSRRRAVERQELRRSVLAGTGLQEALALPAGGRPGVEDALEELLTQVAFGLTDRQAQLLELAQGCARFFDVEEALVEESARGPVALPGRPLERVVPYPTDRLVLETTHRLEDVGALVLRHPSALLYDLASGQQQVRRYLEPLPSPAERPTLKTAVRVYVLDASGSMSGARARLRDALLVAELNAIRVKARLGLPFDPLYFSLFNDVPTELERVDSAGAAAGQIATVFGESRAFGQTDITLALVAAFDSIRAAQGKDPHLARATVVLVTDGEDAVDLERLRAAQRPFAGLTISLSFISLGEENPDLKRLVLEQRRGGARAFYHHLSDAELKVVKSDFDSLARTLLPAELPPGQGTAEALQPHLEALEALAQGRPVRRRDNHDARFEALFPEAGVGRASTPHLHRLADVALAVAEAAPLSTLEARPTEAVTLLLHLLQVYGLSLDDWLAAAASGEAVVRSPVESIRRSCRPLASRLAS